MLLLGLAAVLGGWAAARIGGPEAPSTTAEAGTRRALAALTAYPDAVRARVERTKDGDTAVLRFRDAAGVGRITVRYLGVDTPESVDPEEPVGCFGPEAARVNRRWATGRRVRLVFDRERVDRYGRLLAAVVPEGWHRSLSARLIAEGYGRVLTIAPNGADAPRLRRLQRRAERRRMGLWRTCGDALRSGE